MTSRPRDKHAPNKLSRHHRIHDNKMDRYMREGFVLADETAYLLDPTGRVEVSGKIRCAGSIVIDVEKSMRPIDGSDDPLVETTKYAYNAHVEGFGNFLRYDNSHQRSGHPDEHHRHVFDWRDPSDHGNVDWVGASGWPTLSEFIDQVHSWYIEHRDEIEAPR